MVRTGQAHLEEGHFAAVAAALPLSVDSFSTFC
jgi:hypothetical protein